MQSNADYSACRRRQGDKAARETELGQAISYRFKRDAKGWRVFVSTQMLDVPVVTDHRRGAIGLDLNADQFAVAETDASGNFLNAWRVPLVTYGRNTHQTEAIIGDAVAGLVDYAREAGKPIVIEKLDFRQKMLATRLRPWCWPVACSAVRSASRAVRSHLSAMAPMSPSLYLQGNV